MVAITPRQRICTLGFLLLLSAIVVGPLLLGSYYDGWRWPLIIIAFFASICLTAAGSREALRSWHGFLLVTMILFLGLQGGWMWYNSWGEYSREMGDAGTTVAWSVKPLESQPFPTLAGSVDRGETWDKLSYILVCLLVIWATRCLVVLKKGRAVRALLDTAFWTGTAVAALGLTQRWTGAEAIYWIDDFKTSYGLFFGTYRSPGVASCLLNVSLAAGLSLLLKPISRSKKDVNPSTLIAITIARVAGVTILLAGAVGAGSKAGAVFGLLTLVLWVAINLRAIISAFYRSMECFPGNRRMERNIVAAVLALAAVLAILSFSETVVKRWDEAHAKDYSSLTGRASINDIVITSIKDPKWEWGAMGQGPGSFYPLFPLVNKSAGKDNTQGVYYYVHNDYLQTLFEWGWLGTLWFAVLIAGACMILIWEIFGQKRKHSKRDTIYMRGCLIAMIIFLMHATVDFPFQIESLAVIFSVLLGIAWAAPSLRETGRRSRD